MSVKHAVHEVFSDVRAKLREFKGEFTKRNFLIACIFCFELLPLLVGIVFSILACLFIHWLPPWVIMVVFLILIFPVFVPWLFFWLAVFTKIGHGNADRGIDILVDRFLKKR